MNSALRTWLPPLLLGLTVSQPAAAWYYGMPAYPWPYAYPTMPGYANRAATAAWPPRPYRPAPAPAWQVYGELDAYGNYVFYIRYRGSVYTMVNRLP